MRLPDCWIRSGLRDAWSSRVNSLKLSRLGHSSHVSGEEEKHIQNANSGVRLKLFSVQTNIYSQDTDDLFQQLYMIYVSQMVSQFYILPSYLAQIPVATSLPPRPTSPSPCHQVGCPVSAVPASDNTTLLQCHNTAQNKLSLSSSPSLFLSLRTNKWSNKFLQLLQLMLIVANYCLTDLLTDAV